MEVTSASAIMMLKTMLTESDYSWSDSILCCSINLGQLLTNSQHFQFAWEWLAVIINRNIIIIICHKNGLLVFPPEPQIIIILFLTWPLSINLHPQQPSSSHLCKMNHFCLHQSRFHWDCHAIFWYSYFWKHTVFKQCSSQVDSLYIPKTVIILIFLQISLHSQIETYP